MREIVLGLDCFNQQTLISISIFFFPVKQKKFRLEKKQMNFECDVLKEAGQVKLIDQHVEPQHIESEQTEAGHTAA